jgi:peptidoglycan/xylan/chitin deacetylase (PgdA/CDA1 family)
MMNRQTLAGVLDGAKLPAMFMSIRARTASPWITVLTYHRVAQPKDAAPFDEGVVDVTPEAFDKQLAFLRERFDVIGIDDLVRFRHGGPLPKNPVLVTFDDGYLDNLQVALPALQKHGLKAVFFIATHYLQERRLFWWDKVNHAIKSSAKESIELTYRAGRERREVSERLVLGPTAKDKAAALRRALRIVKDTFALDLPAYLDALYAACGVSFTREEERRLADRMLMTWDQVRALRAAGMDVQSHTSTHRVLQTVPEEELASELRGSRELLQEILGEPVRAVSYPVGKPLKYTPHVRQAVRDAGYDLGFSNATGINHRWDFDPYDARRISLDADLSDAFFRAMMALPYLSY